MTEAGVILDVSSEIKIVACLRCLFFSICTSDGKVCQKSAGCDGM